MSPPKPKAPLEIEHKFLMPLRTDPAPLLQQLARLHPQHTAEALVTEHYYAAAHKPGLVFRHSFDPERQALTVKSRSLPDATAPDTEVRLEQTLLLERAHGSQEQTVAALLSLLDVQPCGSLQKRLWAFYFADCEIVYYQAQTTSTKPARAAHCLEIEALTQDLSTALPILQRYEQALSLNPAQRERRSLFDLLFAPPPVEK